jgi:hypothetical protein
MVQKFAGPSRTLASLSAFALIGCGSWQLVQPIGGAGTGVGLSIYTICVSAIVFLIELPLLCSCFKICVTMSRYTKPVAGFWLMRSLLYTLIGAGAIAIYLVSVPARVQHFADAAECDRRALRRCQRRRWAP